MLWGGGENGGSEGFVIDGDIVFFSGDLCYLGVQVQFGVVCCQLMVGWFWQQLGKIDMGQQQVGVFLLCVVEVVVQYVGEQLG